MVHMIPGFSAHDLISPGVLRFLEVLLATPVVLWGRWPFFVRGIQSVINRSLNMFTLIGLGVGVAYIYSLVAALAPGIFPASFLFPLDILRSVEYIRDADGIRTTWKEGMGTMIKILRVNFTAISVMLLLSAGASWGEMRHDPSAGESKIEKGIKATLKVTPSKNMVDLILEDAKTGKAITEADVNAKVQMPDGSLIEKKLAGMKMGEIFSFMTSFDMHAKGTYRFDISVRTGNRDVQFNFQYDNK